jgi:hypothetical protein
MQRWPSWTEASSLQSELNVSRVTIYRMEKRGDIPPAQQIGPLKRWRTQDLIDAGILPSAPPQPELA